VPVKQGCITHEYITYKKVLATSPDTTSGPTAQFKMVHYGSGYCSSGFYAGHDSKGICNQSDCNEVCLADSSCMYAALKPGQTCSRYNIVAGACETRYHIHEYITFKKVLAASPETTSEMLMGPRGTTFGMQGDTGSTTADRGTTSGMQEDPGSTVADRGTTSGMQEDPGSTVADRRRGGGCVRISKELARKKRVHLCAGANP